MSFNHCRIYLSKIPFHKSPWPTLIYSHGNWQSVCMKVSQLVSQSRIDCFHSCDWSSLSQDIAFKQNLLYSCLLVCVTFHLSLTIYCNLLIRCLDIVTVESTWAVTNRYDYGLLQARISCSIAEYHVLFSYVCFGIFDNTTPHKNVMTNTFCETFGINLPCFENVFLAPKFVLKCKQLNSH